MDEICPRKGVEHADIGPIHATHETRKTIPLSPILGGVALAGGIVLVIVGAKNKP